MIIETFFPRKRLTNIDLETLFPDWSAAKIEEKVGIKERFIVEENETALDLAFEASNKALRSFDKSKIDFVLLCTQSPDYLLPTSACILQDKLGLRTNIGALDFNLGCSGFIYGLALAKSLIKTGLAANVLMVTSETYSKHIHPNDRSNRSIFGDAAAATIVSSDDVENILEFDLGTDGQGMNNLILMNGGMRNRLEGTVNEWVDDSGNARSNNHLFMNGPEIFNFTIEKVPLVVENILKKNNTTLNEIDYVIFHQANKYILNYLRMKLQIPKDKFYINMISTGNTVSSTIPIALKDCRDQNLIKEGDRVLIVGFGVGYSWGGTILRIA